MKKQKKYISLKNFYAKTSEETRNAIKDLLIEYDLDTLFDLQMKYHDAADRKALAARWTAMGLAELVGTFNQYEAAADILLDEFLIALNKVEMHHWSATDIEAYNKIYPYVASRMRFKSIRKFIKRNEFEPSTAYCTAKVISRLSKIIRLPEHERAGYTFTIIRHAAYDYFRKYGDQPTLIDPIKVVPSETAVLEETPLSKKAVCIREALFKLSEVDRHLLVTAWLKILPRDYAAYGNSIPHTDFFDHLLDDIPMRPSKNKDAKYISNRRGTLTKRFLKIYDKLYHK